MSPLKSFLIAAGAASAAAVLTACGVSEAKVTAVAEPAPIPVEVALAARGDINALYTGTTTLEAESEAPVLAKVGGEIVAILAEEGDAVQAGQVLARLDGERLRLAMVQARANLARLQQEYRRNVELHEKGLLSAGAFENLKYEVDALEAAYQLARLEFSYTEIRAPIAGVIAARQIKLGNSVASGEELFLITDPASLLAYLHVPQHELAKLQPGQRAQLRLDALPGTEFAARIARISPTVNADTGTFKVTVELSDAPRPVSPGMFGRVNIVYAVHADALLLPHAAVLQEDYETAVFVVEEGVAHRRVVTTGLDSNGQIEITSGLDEAAQVVVIGQQGLKDGARVRDETDRQS